MLNIYTANQIESLISQLCYNIQSQPLHSPFDPEIIAVGNSAMERWLQVNISQLLGVEANTDFPLPASLLWTLLSQHFPDLSEQDPLGRTHLQWRIFSHLPQLLAKPEFSRIARYIQNDTQGVKRWQLAAQISDIFDRYQYYRNDWTEYAQDENQWQTILWQSLIEEIEYNKVQLLHEYIAALQSGIISSEQLPERISLFAPSTLPPLLLNLLLQLSEWVQIDFYLLAPTHKYWLDLVSQKVEAKIRLSRPDELKYMETGNRLLSSWGRQGQVFFDQLVSVSEYTEEYQHFQEPENQTVLQQLKYDIYHLLDANHDAEKMAKQDNSLSIHICHSPLREIQVLHNNLLHLLDNDPNLYPEDILVVAPNISDYAAYIEAVFRQSDDMPFIAWNISDLNTNEDIPLIRAFLQLFKLAESRFTQSEILMYLEVAEVQQKFGLDNAEVKLIKQWLEAGAIRWGKSAKHKASLNLPALSQNTWEQSEHRLFMGYAMGDIDSTFEDIAPLSDIEGNNSEILGKFWQFYSTLENYSQRFNTPQTLTAWQISINQLLESFFADQQLEESHLQTIRDAVDQLMLNAEGITVDTLISRQLLRIILESSLAEVGNLHRFMSGGVSFSGFKPMRNLPFKVIAVLGLNDGSFPRQVHKIEFDLMQQHYQVGDPNPRDEDRYLFLETLLSAQDQLLISYVGRNIKDNTEKQASVLLKELLDYIDIRFCDPQQPERLYSDLITQVHRLQAYHPSYFKTPANVENDADDTNNNSDNVSAKIGINQQSYANYWCNIAKQVTQINQSHQENNKVGNSHNTDLISWQQRPELAAPDEAWYNIDVSQLIRFFKHPMRFFLQQRLGIYLHRDSNEIHDDEPFNLDALEKYKLKNTLLEEWQQQHQCQDNQAENSLQQTDQAVLYAKGILPHGHQAEELLAQLQSELEPVIKEAEQLLADELPQSLAIDLHFYDDTTQQDYTIQGSLAHAYPAIGLVEMKAGKLNGADQVNFWISYMCYRLSEASDYCQDGYFIDNKACYHIPAEAISQTDAKDYLNTLLAYYHQGICKPLALLPKSSYALVQAKAKHKHFNAEKSPEWQSDGEFNRPLGDQYDHYIQVILRGLSDLPINSQEFIQISGDVHRFDLSKL